MSRARSAFLVLLFCLLPGCAIHMAQTESGPSHAAYLDPALQGSSGAVNVIVTGRDSRVASRVVESAGGEVTSDLWIINAVAAKVPADSIHRIASDPAILSIISNKKVRASDWNGWMSELRVARGTYSFSTPVSAPTAFLPDGGFVAVSQGGSTNGELLIVNEDGSERKRISLPMAGYWSSPVVRPDSSFYILGTSDTGTLSYFSSAGVLMWRQNVPVASNVKAMLAYGSDRVYCLDGKGKLFSIDPEDGWIRWQLSLPTRSTNPLPPIIASNRIYAAMGSGEVYEVNEGGALKWSANAGFTIAFPPKLSNDAIYVTGTKNVAAIATTGVLRYNFTAGSTIAAEPLTSGDTAFVVAQNAVYSIGRTGTVQFAFTSGNTTFRNSPSLSPDGKSLYVTGRKEGLLSLLLMQGCLISLNSTTGAQKWIYTTNTTSLPQAVVDPDGGILLAEGSSIDRRSPANGSSTNHVELGKTANDLSDPTSTGDLIVKHDSSLSFVGRLPDQWNGKPDVQNTKDNDRFKLAHPFVTDVGADLVHKSGITGKDIGVAVVDSGVYWDEFTLNLLGLIVIQDQFIGQADFVESNCGSTGRQYTGYCFHGYQTSRDGYGHGTHVSGIISSKFIEDQTSTRLGVAPDADTLSVRVLDNNGTGSYETVIKGIQYVVEKKSTYNIRVLNLSLSAYATVPYFVDPLNRAVERAWQSGIVVVAAAGNTGPFAQSITVPGNDPYVITTGALQTNRTASFWKDDVVAGWSATGPTFDGFLKPDVVVTGSQIVSFMFNDPSGRNTPTLVRQHPDYSATTTLFRMNGTSMSTAIVSGIAALMLDKNSSLTPDEVKYRMMNSSRMALDPVGQPVFNTFQQGLGRLWAVEAVNDPYDSADKANRGMNITSDLAYGYTTVADLAFHYQGPVDVQLSDDRTAYLFYGTDTAGITYAFGACDLNGNWLPYGVVAQKHWSGINPLWSGGLSWSGNPQAFGSAKMTWAGAKMTWAGTRDIWGGAKMTWAGAKMTWAGGNGWAGGAAWGSAKMTWAGNADAYAVAKMTWAGSISGVSNASSFRWINDDWTAPPSSGLPPAAGTK
jgi:serine protease AprX